ncbi:MAG: hypothetical protein DMF84_29780 [Acidobacteria bacterium]|nr:MAG: hypothetical protein DMF84_29780 [Acidobacteriota bacterium]
MPRVTLEQARAAKAAALRHFEQLGTVVGVGITRIDGDYAVKINLREPLAEGTEPPAEIEGVPVRVEVVGTIRKQ